ncbi:MAG TPA: hypothetical protein DCY02_07290 [Armatimonadetes bacterium]|nr:hypothetical protein [Armatimonadota bacterium]HRI45441.1 SdpI family protein [Fimbriimonadaceae bacterium]
MIPLLLTLMMFGLGLLLAVAGFPMALGRVGRNSIYGFRTRKTLSSDHVWYLANRHSGRRMILAGAAIMLLSVPFGMVAPLLGKTFAPWLMLALIMVPILWMLASSLKYLARL